MVSLANRRSNLFLVSLTLVVALAAAVPARATPIYSITDLGAMTAPLIANYQGTDPTAFVPLTINAQGQVGWLTSQLQPGQSGDVYYGQLFTSGGYEVGNPGNPFNRPDAATGMYESAYAQYIGTYQNISPPGSLTSEVRALSSSGSVVGGAWSSDVSSSFTPFVHTIARGFVDLNVGNLKVDTLPGGIILYPLQYLGINGQNQVVGTYNFAQLGPPNYGGINHAFIAALAPGTMGYGGVDLNTLIPANSGWILTSATGINDAGQIVGYGINPQGVYAGYELTPVSSQVPEPSVLAFFGLVGLCLGARELTRHNRRDRKVAVES